MRDQRLYVICVGSEVTIIVKLLNDDEFNFKFEAGSAWAARLLSEAIRKSLERSSSLDREEFYKKGRKSARDKRYKITHFRGILP